MSPKLVRNYPHVVENRGITMAPLFLISISWKSPPQSIKIFVKLDFFTNVLVDWFVFVYTESYWEQQLSAPEKKWHFGFQSGKNVNLKFTLFAMSKPKQQFFSAGLTALSAQLRVNQNKRNNQNNCEKVKLDKDFKWLGKTFSLNQSQN